MCALNAEFILFDEVPLEKVAVSQFKEMIFRDQRIFSELTSKDQLSLFYVKTELKIGSRTLAFYLKDAPIIEEGVGADAQEDEGEITLFMLVTPRVSGTHTLIVPDGASFSLSLSLSPCTHSAFLLRSPW